MTLILLSLLGFPTQAYGVDGRADLRLFLLVVQTSVEGQCYVWIYVLANVLWNMADLRQLITTYFAQLSNVKLQLQNLESFGV